MATAVYMGMQGRLFEWFKNEGDEVSRGDVVAEVESMDRVTTIDVHARESGVLRRRLVNIGDEGSAETIIAIIGALGEDISALTGAGAATVPPMSFAAETAPVREVQQAAATGQVKNGSAAGGETREETTERGTPPETILVAPTPAAAQEMGAGDGQLQTPPPPAPPREPGMQDAGVRRTGDGAPVFRSPADQRSELVDGRAIALGASSLVHNLILSNIVGTLFAALRGKACRVVSQGMPVKTGRGENVFLPDVAVYCGEAELERGAAELLLNPTVLVEVLSPESTDYDHGKKWESYRRLSSLHDYLLVWHDQARVEWYTRQGTFWMFGEVEGVQAEVRLEPIAATLRLADIYEGVLTADQPSA
ncbi:MAG TPA: Uma2 family endonuclease [Longimicrobium sp.]